MASNFYHSLFFSLANRQACSAVKSLFNVPIWLEQLPIHKCATQTCHMLWLGKFRRHFPPQLGPLVPTHRTLAHALDRPHARGGRHVGGGLALARLGLLHRRRRCRFRVCLLQILHWYLIMRFTKYKYRQNGWQILFLREAEPENYENRTWTGPRVFLVCVRPTNLKLSNLGMQQCLNTSPYNEVGDTKG